MGYITTVLETFVLKMEAVKVADATMSTKVDVSTCAFVKINGETCQNNAVEDGDGYCHLDSHNAMMSEMNSKISEERKEFVDAYYGRTLDIADYHLEDVLADDACLFRSLALGLFANIEDIKFSDEMKACLTHEETNLEEGFIHLSDETDLARSLQDIARKWIIVNKAKNLESCGGETVEDIVKNTHELDTLEEYAELYSIFAGEINKTFNSKTGKMEWIQPRWGGFPEEVALSDMFEVDISIYVPRRVNYTYDGIVPSHMLRNGTRFEVYTDVKFTGDREGKDIPKIELLLIDRMKKPHYNLMISKTLIEDEDDDSDEVEDEDNEGDDGKAVGAGSKVAAVAEASK